ncbi:MAG: SecY-interacting protein [Idiomarina sp.]|nr:SecY-interacting protein [Idiomarina sp.]
MSDVLKALTELHDHYAAHYREQGTHPVTEYIKEWNAPCYVGQPKGDEIHWEAVVQAPRIDFTNVEQGLEMPIHESVKDFFSGYWAGDLDVSFRDIQLTLLQVMLPMDAERLQKNLIGHVLMKQRLQQPITLFIGVGIEDDLMLTVHNDNGAVGLEYAGKDQHQILAGDLESFLRELKPL